MLGSWKLFGSFVLIEFLSALIMGSWPIPFIFGEKKTWTCPSSCWGAGLLSKYSCWWARGHGAFEQHLGFLWLAVLATSLPGDQEGGTIRPWHGHLAISARKQPFPLPCVLSPAGVRPRKGKGIRSLPLPSQERVCPCEAHWHTRTDPSSTAARWGGAQGVGFNSPGSGAFPTGKSPGVAQESEWSQCVPWRWSALRPVKIGADDSYQLCVCARKKKKLRDAVCLLPSRARSLSSALSLPLQTLDLNLLRIQHRGSSLG